MFFICIHTNIAIQLYLHTYTKLTGNSFLENGGQDLCNGRWMFISSPYQRRMNVQSSGSQTVVLKPAASAFYRNANSQVSVETLEVGSRIFIQLSKWLQDKLKLIYWLQRKFQRLLRKKVNDLEWGFLQWTVWIIGYLTLVSSLKSDICQIFFLQLAFFIVIILVGLMLPFKVKYK